MQTWERTWTVTPGAGVIIDQCRGPVRVAGWDREEVRIVATSDADEPLEQRLKVEHGDGGLRLTVLPERRGFLGIFSREEAVQLEVQVPFGTPLSLDSGSGSVEVTATRGPVRIDSGSGRVTVMEVRHADIDGGSGRVTVRRVDGSLRLDGGSGSVEVEEVGGAANVDVGSGSVTVRKVAGGLRVDTGSGSVTATDIVGGADVDTGSGSVTLERVVGPLVRVDTGSGRVRMREIDAQKVVVDTSSGGIQLELAAVRPDGEYRLHTDSGTANIALPPDAGVTLSLESATGRIHYGDLPIRVVRSDQGELEGMMNSGGARLVVKAVLGVTLRPAEAPAAPGAPGRSPAPAAPDAPPSPGAPSEQPAGPPPEPPVAEALDALDAALRQDAALANSEHIHRVLQMVEEGKLSPEEASEILSALDEGENSA